MLRFHDTSEAGMIRHWRKVDTLECHLGYWQGEWTQHEEGKPPKGIRYRLARLSIFVFTGIRKFNASEELQCSSVHPGMQNKYRLLDKYNYCAERLTAQGKIVVGVCGGIGGLLFIGVSQFLAFLY